MKKRTLRMMIGTIVLLLVSCIYDPGQTSESSALPTDNSGKINSLQELIDNAGDDDTIINLSEYKDVTNFNYTATINKAVTISGGSLNNAMLTIETDGVKLNNIQNANVTAAAKLGNGTLKISGSSLNSLNILGGGANSIHLLGGTTVSNASVNKIKQNSNDEYVRLVLDSSVTVTSLTVKSSVIIDATGDTAVTKTNLPSVSFDVTSANSSVGVSLAVAAKVTFGNNEALARIFISDSSSNDSLAFFVKKNEEKSIIKEDFFKAAVGKLISGVSEDKTQTMIEQFDEVIDNTVSNDVKADIATGEVVVESDDSSSSDSSRDNSSGDENSSSSIADDSSAISSDDENSSSGTAGDNSSSSGDGNSSSGTAGDSSSSSGDENSSSGTAGDSSSSSGDESSSSSSEEEIYADATTLKVNITVSDITIDDISKVVVEWGTGNYNELKENGSELFGNTKTIIPAKMSIEKTDEKHGTISFSIINDELSDGKTPYYQIKFIDSNDVTIGNLKDEVYQETQPYNENTVHTIDVVIDGVYVTTNVPISDSSASISINILPNSEINVTQNTEDDNIVLTADENYANYSWFIDGNEVIATGSGSSVIGAIVSDDSLTLTLAKGSLIRGAIYQISLSAVRQGIPYGTQIAVTIE